jgi:hypothetical protein
MPGKGNGERLTSRIYFSGVPEMLRKGKRESMSSKDSWIVVKMSDPRDRSICC